MLSGSGAGRHNVVGGSAAGKGNLIAGNRGSSVYITGGEANVVEGNQVGLSGSTLLANVTNGVRTMVERRARPVGLGNAIRGNGRHGVFLNGSRTIRSTLTENSISDTTEQGIDLSGGINFANERIRLPIIAHEDLGEVRGSACPGCRVEVISRVGLEGKTFLGAVTAAAHGGWSWGDSSWNREFTATATDGRGNTSEVTNCRDSRKPNDDFHRGRRFLLVPGQHRRHHHRRTGDHAGLSAAAVRPASPADRGAGFAHRLVAAPHRRSTFAGPGERVPPPAVALAPGEKNVLSSFRQLPLAARSTAPPRPCRASGWRNRSSISAAPSWSPSSTCGTAPFLGGRNCCRSGACQLVPTPMCSMVVRTLSHFRRVATSRGHGGERAPPMLQRASTRPANFSTTARALASSGCSDLLGSPHFANLKASAARWWMRNPGGSLRSQSAEGRPP